MEKKGFNHNKLAIIFPIVVLAMLTYLVCLHPEIGIAPQEIGGKILMRLSIFFSAAMLFMRALGGWKYSVTENAKNTPYGMIAIACALIIGAAIVITK